MCICICARVCMYGRSASDALGEMICGVLLQQNVFSNYRMCSLSIASDALGEMICGGVLHVLANT